MIPAVAAAAALGFVAQRWMSAARDAGAPVAMSTSAAHSSGAGAEATPEEAPPPIPEVLPGFSLADGDGKPHALAEWTGRPLMVNFWATWCGPCKREIPLLNTLREEGRPKGLEIIGIAVDFPEDVLAYTKETTISYPILIGEDDGWEAIKSLGMQPVLPFTVFADSKQRILTVKTGELHREEADLILGKLAAVDAGTLSLAQARIELDAGLKELALHRATGADHDHDDEAPTG